MKKRKPIILLFCISLLGIILGFYLKDALHNGACFSFNTFCLNLMDSGYAIHIGSISIAFTSILLIIFPSTYTSWKKFASFFIPSAVFIFFIFPRPGHWDPITPHPETVARWINYFYLIISMGIIFLTLFIKKFRK